MLLLIYNIRHTYLQYFDLMLEPLKYYWYIKIIKIGGKNVEVTFKIATTNEDVVKIIELCNTCFFEETSLEYAKNIFEKTKNDENQIYLMGLIDGKVVAHAKITVIPTIYEKMNTYAILNHVCVHPDYRRHGIATTMLDEITKICINHNCKAMELWSNNVRKAAHACYYHYGFKLDEAGFFSKQII